ncbi:ATP-binding protein [Aureisphaera galaxeae]|uniref:sensor histidine kinase n=1 Tax=Aureisphaera galaxeae TaxID=1538023 RepID=UPI0023508985|nr:ATP-binding protein [Aureisphaera galaxeae]MDC8006070.1 ATP-binding protein [Aureisphaera galaxeae]
MDEEGVQSFLIIFSIITFCLALTVIILFAIFQKRKNKLLREQQEAENRFKEEIIETQVEIREETLRNISWELHDNIGQMLTLAKIQLQNVDNPTPSIHDASETIGKSLTELRSLSKLINPDTFNSLSLVEALKLEIERFNRMQYLEASLKFSKETFALDHKVEVIFFRILQEFFTNTIKHSKASKLEVNVDYKKDLLSITAKDNGIGFDTTELDAKKEKGIGLTNIKSRAALINANAEIVSQEGKGTQLNLTYKNQEL